MFLNLKAKILLLVIIAAVLAGCSNTKHLAKEERLFTGSKINITDKVAGKKEKKLITKDMKGLVRPRPNSTLLGMRLKLTLYNAAGSRPKEKGIRRWLREKVGEPPVEASSIHLEPNKKLLITYLMNRGYFYPQATARMEEKKGRKAIAVFDIATGPQYDIKSTIFLNDSSKIAAIIDSNFSNTLLKPGQPYNLDLITAERVRIDKQLKEKGYYFFKPEYLILIADTSIGDHKVNLYLRLKQNDIPDEVFQPYKINDIFIYAGYKLQSSQKDTSKANMVKEGDYYIIDSQKAFKPSVFSRAIISNKGDLFSLDDQNTSLSRLVNMSTFKFVKNRFDPVSDSLLDIYYYLTPYSRKSIQFEIGALTQNDDRAGTNGSISWKNRNVFRGAEQLAFKIGGGLEAQYSGLVKQPNIYNLSAETDLTVPRFDIPFWNIQTTTRYLPHTVFKLAYKYESESDLLRINSYTAAYGFDWKQGAHIRHQFYPFSFTYVKTDTLGNDSTISLLYGNLIFNGIIEGSTYEFTYSSQGAIPRKNTFYFDGLVELSGTILGTVEHADYYKNPRLLFGSPYAEYFKAQPDFRYYLRLSGASVVAARLLAGIGIPYGNSIDLPNIKQFWAGGNSDMRGFPSRLVGPGTFNEYSEINSSQYIETLGDLKLEGNIELRQKIYQFIQGAIFADAGNIWLYHADPAIPGGEFTSDFYKEISADVGVGLRFDFSILILRLDIGMPVREAWLPENERWVFRQIDFSDPGWKSRNLVYNVGIGFPF